MPVELTIRDGNPWWMSPDVWVVPGTDPNGAPGMPVAGEPAYLWARVTNAGTAAVSNATVRFYWANPSVGFDRTTATQIGTSFVTLDPGEVTEVLCLTPWVPIYLNQGHECVLAEAFHNSDALPSGSTFNVPTDRHVAQLNLALVHGAGPMRYPFTIVNRERVSNEFTVRVRQGHLRELQPLRKQLPRIDVAVKEGRLRSFAFSEEVCPTDARDPRRTEPLVVKLRGGSSAFRTLVAIVEGGPTLVHVEQIHRDRIVGGLSVLFVPEATGHTAEVLR